MKKQRQFLCSSCNRETTRYFYRGTSSIAQRRNTTTLCGPCTRKGHEVTAETRAKISAGKKKPTAEPPRKSRMKIVNGYRVQGRYELLYMRWLQRNRIRFVSHPLPGLRLEINGKQTKYFPDFYLIDTEEYVDVKHSRHLRDVRYKNVKKIEVLRTMGYSITITTNSDIWYDHDEYMELRRAIE